MSFSERWAQWNWFPFDPTRRWIQSGVLATERKRQFVWNAQKQFERTEGSWGVNPFLRTSTDGYRSLPFPTHLSLSIAAEMFITWKGRRGANRWVTRGKRTAFRSHSTNQKKLLVIPSTRRADGALQSRNAREERIFRQYQDNHRSIWTHTLLSPSSSSGALDIRAKRKHVAPMTNCNGFSRSASSTASTVIV